MRYDTVIEEYIEIIGGIVTENQEARVKDIARSRGVTLPTASSAVERLRVMGLVNHEHYGTVTLTRSGKKLASELNEYHAAIKKLLVNVLGVPEKIADEDACKLEHQISEETVQSLLRLLKFLEKCPRGGTDWLEILHGCSVFTDGNEEGCLKCRWLDRKNNHN